MENTRTAIKKLKKNVKELTAEGLRIRGEIHVLAWTDDKPPRRRPETGPERALLWDGKRGVGRTARLSLLAYGLLRGLPYKAMEPKCREGNEPSCSLILAKMHEVLGPESEDALAWTQERVVSLVFKGTDPVKEAA